MSKKQQTLLLIGVISFTLLYVGVRNTLQKEIYLSTERVSFKVYNNENLGQISERLEQSGIIKSARLLRLYLSWKQFDTKLLQGEFRFTSPISIVEVADLLLRKPSKPLLIVTIPEGSDNSKVADFFIKKNPSLQKEKILLAIESRGASGYLFPDTYFLSGTEKEDQIIEKMLFNFKEKYGDNFNQEGKSINAMIYDLTIQRHLSIASILEGEAKTEYDMKVITGILLKREKIGMKLQVDAAKETYSKKGFPEIPINNPGLVSLRAANNPIETKYLYYITGNDGKMYYAKTYAEHKKNIIKYLR